MTVHPPLEQRSGPDGEWVSCRRIFSKTFIDGERRRQSASAPPLAGAQLAGRPLKPTRLIAIARKIDSVRPRSRNESFFRAAGARTRP